MLIPKQIIIEVTDRCNLSCKLCPSVGHQENTGFMSVEDFQSIIDRVDFPTTIIPWMNGEPLLHPEYARLVKYVTDRKLPCYITTNGMIHNGELFDLITDDTSCYQIIFSIDGLTDRIQKLARPGSSLSVI